MDHTFVPSSLDSSKCSRCKYDELSHTDRATCEACSNSGTMELFAGMLLCVSCIEAEMKATMLHQSPEKQAERMNTYQATIEASRAIDQSIRVVSDVFNAKTVAIVELKDAIDANPDIPSDRKAFALASELDARFQNLTKVIFDMKAELTELSNERGAIQLYFNQLSNKLRVEEREKFKITDINYQPAKPKLVTPKEKKTRKPSAPKFDRAELTKYATELGVPMNALQVICIRRGCTPEVAASILKEQMGL